MKKIIFYLSLLLTGVSGAFAQDNLQQNSNWIFGGQGYLNIMTSTAYPRIGFDLGDCATVSDSCGQLLFATDGQHVWRFVNGQPILLDVTLYGSTNSYFPYNDLLRQNVIIVPRPNHPNNFYIVTTHSYGLYYSEIDLTTGNGTFPSLNIRLEENLFSIPKSLTSTLAGDGQNYWVIASDLDNMYSFLADENGIGVTDELGNHSSNNSYNVGQLPSINNYNYYFQSNMTKCVKISPDGLRFALADKKGYVFGDFDNVTGTFNANFYQTLSTTGSPFPGSLCAVNLSPDDASIQGMEFSPDSQNLYIASSGFGVNGRIWKVKPYNYGEFLQPIMMSYNPCSEKQVTGLQLGSNGNIYGIIKNQYYFLEITDPNCFECVSYGNTMNYIPLAQDTYGYYRLPQWVPLQPSATIGVTPTFNDIAILGGGQQTYTLPTTSSNGVAGSWDSSLMEGEHTYTFYPDNSCSPSTTMTLTLLTPNAIHANDDAFQVDLPVNNGSTAVVTQTASIYNNDTIGASMVTAGDVGTTSSIHFVLGSRQETANSDGYAIVLHADGTITIPAGFPYGTFTITYTIASNSCTANTSTATVTVTVGTVSYARKSKPTLTDTIPVYPNPSNSIFNIDLSNVKESYNSIKVYNLLGSVIYEGNLLKSLNQIDLSNVPTGYYFAHLSNGENNTTVKLIKN